MITQRLTRKMDSINHAVKAGMSTSITAFLLILQDHVARVPALEEFAASIKSILDQETNAPLLGDTLRRFLIALQGQAFEVKVSFMEQLYESVLPLLDDFAADFAHKFEHRPGWLSTPLIHHGVTCDHCGAAPIAGPRWNCTICPDYDLCGNCFAQKTKIHGRDFPDHDFQCILTEGKGKGKGKGCKGWGKHKGHMWRHMHNFFQQMHQHMKGTDSKGWGKGTPNLDTHGPHGADARDDWYHA
jgi:hypothetical protein